MNQFGKDYFCSTSVYRKFSGARQASTALSDYYFGQYRSFKKRFFRSLTKKQAKVLEVGCGYSGLIDHLLRDEFNYYGSDISDYIVEEMRKIYPSSNFCRLDIQEGRIDGTFDLILSMQVLEHLPCPEKALKNILSSLGPGGIFLATVPNPRSKIPLTDWRTDSTHVSIFPREVWEGLFREAGFGEVESTTFFTLPGVWRFFPRLGLPFFISKFGASILISAQKPRSF